MPDAGADSKTGPNLAQRLECMHRRHCRPITMEPAVGIEPTTRSLQNCCSTTELSWLQIQCNFASAP
jgi:hypothetical protein